MSGILSFTGRLRQYTLVYNDALGESLSIEVLGHGLKPWILASQMAQALACCLAQWGRSGVSQQSLGEHHNCTKCHLHHSSEVNTCKFNICDAVVGLDAGEYPDSRQVIPNSPR